MLPDRERKLLRILYNYAGQHNRMPTMQGLEIMTGLNKLEVKDALLTLKEERYILWEEKSSLDSIKIIEGWEREPETNKSRSSKRSPLYWTDY